MTIAYQALLSEKIQHLKPYLPGKSIKEIEDKYQIHDVIKLASNENAWGCSKKVLKAIKSCRIEDISCYPNTYLHPFFKTLYEFLDIPAENLFISNGSDAIFSLLIQAYALPMLKNTCTHHYAFMGYEIQTRSFGLDCIKVKINPETWQFDIDEVIKACYQNVAIVFISNPNNPTGQFITWVEIKSILNNIPDNCLLVIDEAYFEYLQQEHPSLQYLLNTYPNLIITRTFSKAYGMASLRLGYAIANECIVHTLKKIQLPFTISQLALQAGLAAIQDQDFIGYTQKLTQHEKSFLEHAFQELPFKVRPCQGNFICIEQNKDVTELVTYLESQGIIIRPLNAFGLNHCARITVGTHEQNTRLLSCLHHYSNK